MYEWEINYNNSSNSLQRHLGYCLTVSPCFSVVFFKINNLI